MPERHHRRARGRLDGEERDQQHGTRAERDDDGGRAPAVLGRVEQAVDEREQAADQRHLAGDVDPRRVRVARFDELEAR